MRAWMGRMAAGWLFVGALGWRLAVVVGWGWDGLYGQDAFAYFRQAVAILERVPQGQMPPLTFFWPNGYPLMVALAMALAGAEPWVALGVALLAGAALAPLAYGLGRELWPEQGEVAGWVAGLVMVVAGQPFLSSVVIMADMPALFWAALATWLLVRAWRSPRGALWLLGAGAALGMALVTRWLYVLAVPALVGYGLLQWRRTRAAAWWLALPVASGLAVLLPQLWLSFHRPDSLAHPWLLTWHPLNALQRQFENADGHFVYALPPGLFSLQPGVHPAYLFPLLGLAALWGVWRLGQRRAWALLLLLLGWSGAVYLFLAGIPYENFRFGLTLYLPLVLLAGGGVAEGWAARRARAALVAGVAFSLVAMMFWNGRMVGEFLHAQSETKAVVRQSAALVPPDGTLLSFGLTLLAEHYTSLPVYDLFFEDEQSLSAHVRAEQPLYLLLDVANVERQWAGRAPALAYHWLRDEAGLREVRRFGAYTLFEVGAGAGGYAP